MLYRLDDLEQDCNTPVPQFPYLKNEKNAISLQFLRVVVKVKWGDT